MSRTALVTGAGGGICEQVARMLAARGHKMLLLDSDAAAVDAVARDLGSALAADPLVVDVTDSSKVERLVSELSDRSRPDILVNGVGGDTRRIECTELTEEELMASIRKDLVSVFTLMRLCVPVMRRRGWGRVVNIASVAGRTNTDFSNAAYVAAKAAVIGLTRQYAYELAPHGVCVNVVAPGAVATPRVQRAFDARDEQSRAQLLDRIPARRFGTAEEAAATIVHLCEETAGYLCGAIIDVNGGMYA